MAGLDFHWEHKNSGKSDYPNIERDWQNAVCTAISHIESVLEVITQFSTDLPKSLYRDKNYESIFSARIPRRDAYVLNIYNGIHGILLGKITLQMSDEYDSVNGETVKTAYAQAIDHEGTTDVVKIFKPGLKMKNDGGESKALILVHDLAHVASYAAHKDTGKLFGLPTRIGSTLSST